MKTALVSFSKRLLWHCCQALAVVLAILVIFERLVPGAVLGHLALFLAVPLLIVCIAVHPAITTKRAKWWLLIDLWVIAALCIGRIFLVIDPQSLMPWLLAGFATALVFAFLWIFSHEPVREETND